MTDAKTHADVPSRPVPAETFAEWESGTFIENLAATRNGHWLVTVPSHNRVDQVDGVDGGHRPLVTLEHHPTGIVVEDDQAFVVTGTIGQPNWRLVSLRRGGRTELVLDLPELRFGNGMQRAGDVLLVNDSSLGIVLAVDPVRRTSEVWLEHEWLTGPYPDRPMPGANGMAVHQGWVYLSNTGRGLILRCALGGDGDSRAPELVAERLAADDFAVHPSGRIYLATHFRNSVLELSPDGTRADIAGPEQGATGSTAVAVDPRDPSNLFVTTTGGMKGLSDTDCGPARLLRLRLSAS
jgi:sugar lactone lactonase YvrE